MAIFSRWGSELKPVARCGEHKPLGGQYLTEMIKCQCDDEQRYYFVFTLRADGGRNEIEQAIANLPEVQLVGGEKKRAIQQAS